LLENSGFSQWRSIAAIASNERGAKILQPLAQNTNVTLWLPESIKSPSAQIYSSLQEQTAKLWQTEQALIFCLATGAVVRTIAPYL
jgi:cobalt-precorrin 5A hydrolase / precorrin-3B C17-methyltransferase